MPKLCFTVIACLFLSACMMPQYHKSTQKIPVMVQTHTKMPAIATLNGEQVPIRMTKSGQPYVLVDRSFENKQLIIRQEKTIQEIDLKSVWTQDKWGRFNNYTQSNNISASWLFLPSNALSMGGFFLKEAFNPDSGRSWYGRIGSVIAAPAAVIAGVPLDIYNWVIGGPATAVINPWREYQVESNRVWKITRPKPQPVLIDTYMIQYSVPTQNGVCF